MGVIARIGGDATLKSDGTSYTYDRRGQLTGATVSGQTVTYELDAMGRRVGRSAVGGFTARRYLYGAGAQPLAQLSMAGAVEAQYVYLTGRHAPDVMVKSGVVYALVTDHLGSVRMVVNVDTGVVAQRISYDAWGNASYEVGTWDVQPFGFAGGLYDPLTKLVHFGAREYDAVTGRWTRADPILFAGGDANLYAYVGNDPVNAIDPSGLVIPGSGRMVEERRERQRMWEDLVSTLFSGVGADWRAGNRGRAIGGALSGAALGVLGAFDMLMSDPSVQMACMGMPAFSAEQAAVVDLAKQAQRAGISVQEAETLMQWAREAGVPFRNDINSSHWVGGGHIHVGPVNHIPVTK